MENLDVPDDAVLAERVGGLTRLTPDQSLAIVREFRRTFAGPLGAKIQSLRMRDIIKTKNPYLYRASGVSTCEELVRRAFNDYATTMGENYFGAFFEAIARIVSGGVKPASGGEIDLEIRRADGAHLYAMKSGPKGFNSSSAAKAKLDLDHAERRLRQDRVPVHKKLGFAYGRRTTSFAGGIERLASKQLWAELSGDPEFYSKLLDVCDVLSPLYTADTEAPFALLLNEARELFCDGDQIDWGKVLKLVSG